jgi:membrane-associated phospholipid phosphatase
MDFTLVWYAITIIGTPEYWAFAATAMVILYFVLRQLAPGNRAWKRYRPTFRKFLLVFIPSIVLVFVVILGIKSVWHVPRPCTPCETAMGNPIDGLFQVNQAVFPGECNPFCDTDSSFPSGHAGTIFVAFSSLYVAFRKRWILPLFIIPALVSYSRMALGVHTWIDVLAGAFLGLLAPVMVSIIIPKKHKSS